MGISSSNPCSPSPRGYNPRSSATLVNAPVQPEPCQIFGLLLWPSPWRAPSARRPPKTSCRHLCRHSARLQPESCDLLRLERAGAYPYKLFCEPKLILGCALRRPNQVHLRGLRHHYAERFTCSSYRQYRSHSFSCSRVAFRPYEVHLRPIPHIRQPAAVLRGMSPPE